jgi:hypothetical protein
MTRQQKHKGRRNEPSPQNVFHSLRHIDEHELIEQELSGSHRRPLSALTHNIKKQVTRCAPSLRTLKILDERDALERRNKQDEAIYKGQYYNYIVSAVLGVSREAQARGRTLHSQWLRIGLVPSSTTNQKMELWLK